MRTLVAVLVIVSLLAASPPSPFPRIGLWETSTTLAPRNQKRIDLASAGQPLHPRPADSQQAAGIGGVVATALRKQATDADEGRANYAARLMATLEKYTILTGQDGASEWEKLCPKGTSGIEPSASEHYWAAQLRRSAARSGLAAC